MISLLAALGLTLSLSATAVFQYIWHTNGSLTYTVSVPRDTKWVCTGWRYPVTPLPENEWPQRWSCREPDLKIWTEKWGGDYMFPYVGKYEACVKTPSAIACQTFSVLEGTGRK